MERERGGTRDKKVVRRGVGGGGARGVGGARGRASWRTEIGKVMDLNHRLRSNTDLHSIFTQSCIA